MKGAIKMLRVSQWYTENEDRFVGLEDSEIDAMIDALPYYSDYDYFNHNGKNYMRISADGLTFEWVFDKDYICTSCTAYDDEPLENEADFWDESLVEIETWEWFRNRI